VQNLMIAVAVGSGVGINAYLSKSLGERKFKEANRAATNGLFVILLSYLAFAVFGLFFSHQYFSSQTDIEQIIRYGDDYLFYVTVFSFGLFFAMTFERLLQATGITIYSMIAQTVGAVANIILDPILIFGFGMGVRGAALATVISQGVSAFWVVAFLARGKSLLRLRSGAIRLKLDVLGPCLALGIAPFIMQAS